MPGVDVDHLRLMTKNLLENPESAQSMDIEEAIKVIRELNPLGNVIPATTSYANLSIYNWREEYLKKFLLTAMVGYIYRLAEEFEPEEEIESMKKRMEGVDSSEVENEEKKIRLTYRRMIKKFLDRNFEFNPDRHLRVAHTDNPADPERKPKEELIKERVATRPVVDKIEKRIADSPDVVFSYIRDNILQTSQIINTAFNNTLNSIKILSDDGLDNEDKISILTKNHVELKMLRDDINKVAAPLALADTLPAVVVTPPINVFHHFKRYHDNHFEQLREVVQALYNEKPDIEFAINYYEAFNNPESARKHRIQHEAEFKYSVQTIENTGLTLLGPFKQNRERVDFYNKNTEPIKRMMEQQEMDHKLGKDLMEKKVKDEKRKNVLRDGPDAPGLATYTKSIGIIRELGSKKSLTAEEQFNLLQAQRDKDMEEVPDEAIQVDVFYPEMDEDGTSTIKKTKFYTQAEAPLHMQKDSEYIDSYQPKRPEGMTIEDTITQKTVISKTGEKIKVTSLKSKLNKLKETK